VTGWGGIPAELRERPQWVIWRLEVRDGKQTKVPYQAGANGRASTTDPGTWATFDQAVATADRADGIGYVFAADDPYTGVDLDGGLTHAEK
jgi:putative DNA primase/helicase